MKRTCYSNLRYLFLIFAIIVLFVQQCAGDCNTFVNTTVIVKVGGTESLNILNGCAIDPSAEEIVIKTSVENVEQGTFKDLSHLNDIKMIGVNIKNIQPGFIENLPNLKYITINLNPLEEIKKGQFSNMQTNIIDLENNNINRIQRAAFENLNTDVLVLNNNGLRNIENGWFKNSIINNLQVTSNKITWLGKDTFAGINNLEFLDLYDNSMYYIQDNTFTGLKLRQLDLSENMLVKTSFLFNTNIQYLHLGMNMISYMFLNSSVAIKTMTIYPNPWRCECLQKFWSYASAHKIELKEPPTYINWKDEFPICLVQTTECVEERGDDDTRNEYFNTLSFAKLQYTSIFD